MFSSPFFLLFFVGDMKRVNHKEARSLCLPFRPPGTQSRAVYLVLCVHERPYRPPDHSLRKCMVKRDNLPLLFLLICQLRPGLIESGLERPRVYLPTRGNTENGVRLRRECDVAEGVRVAHKWMGAGGLWFWVA